MLAGALSQCEISFELTYQLNLSDMIVIQLDIQYIANPGLDPTARGAVAVCHALRKMA